MKKFLIALIAVLLCAAMTAGVALAEVVYVSSTGSGSLNLRSGPGKTFAVVGYVYHNDVVTQLEVSGEWSRVKRAATGETGWIKTKYIDGTTKALGTGTKTVSTVNGGSLNLRKGPGTTYGVRGTVANGATVQVIGTEDDWVKISVIGGQTGWIKAKYISGSSGGSSGGGSLPSKFYVGHVTASTLNVRKGAGSGYTKVGELHTGDGFKVTGSQGNWYSIEAFNGLKGWISKNFAAVGATGRVTAVHLNLRQGAGTNTGVIDTLTQGTLVTVDYITGNWAHVSVGFQQGFVSLKYLAF